MVFFNRWYRMLGFSRQSHLISPRMLSNETITYPRDSEIYLFKVSPYTEKISRNLDLLHRHPSIFVKTYTEYGQDITGNFRKLPFNQMSFIKELSKNVDNIRFLKPTESRLVIKPKTLIVKNFNSINKYYRYIKNMYTHQSMFLNTINSVIEEINKDKGKETFRTKFLVIDLPDVLPKREKLEQFSRNLNVSRLKYIKDYKYFTFLEIWKYLTPDLKEKSVFNKLDINLRPYINLVLNINSKSVVINMAILENLVKEYNTDKVGNESIELDSNFELLLTSFDNVGIGTEDIKKEAVFIGKSVYKAVVLKKLFLLLCNKLIQASETINVPSSDLESEFSDVAISKFTAMEDLKVEKEKAKLSKNKNLDLNSTDDILEQLIEDNLQAYVTKDENEDDILGEKEVLEEDDEGNVIEVLEDITNLAVSTNDTLSKNNTVKYNTFEEVIKAPANDTKTTLKEAVELCKEEGIIRSKKEAEKLINSIEETENITVGIGNESMVIKDVLDYKNDVDENHMATYTISDNNTVFDKSYSKGTVEGFDKQYLSKTIDKDRIRTLFGFRNAGIIIESYSKEESRDILNDNEIHTLSIKPLNGSRTNKLRVIVPKVQEDGTFRMSGNNYRLRKQRVEKTISKISPTEVLLTSYYGKRFITKGGNAVKDTGRILSRFAVRNPDITNIVMGTTTFIDTKLPDIYSKIARNTRSFTYDKKLFIFDGSMFNKHPEIADYSVSGYLQMGYVQKDPETILVMDKDGFISLYNTKAVKGFNLGNLVPYKHILEVIDPSGEFVNNMVIEHASMKVANKEIPLFFILCYYLGLENLFSILGTEYKVYELGDYNYKKELGEDIKNWYGLKLRDKALLIKKDNGKSDILFGCLTLETIKKPLREIRYSSFNDRGEYNHVFNILNFGISQLVDIKLMETMFIDPMTLSLLKQTGEPETFHGLLLKALELLSSEYAPKPTNIELQLIKGYERINGMIYRSMVDAIKEHERTLYNSKSRINFDPYSVINKLKEDSTQVLVDDLNPIAMIKQKEDVSYLGEGGQGSTRSINKERRAIDESEIGIFSEAHKDNGNVGVTAYLTPDFNIKNTRGSVESVDVNNEGWGKVLSTPALLAPFATKDDSKRANFISIMGAHIVPIRDMSAPVIRTGYESILPIRVGDKFCIVASGNGIITKVDAKVVVVKYDGLSKETTYKIRSFTTKEESGSCYTYTMIPNVKVGDKVNKDDTLLYNPMYFEPDIFNPARVIYKQGTYVKVAITEDKETYEDSGGISSKMSEVMSSKLTKVVSIVINKDNGITNVKNIGDHVEPTDTLFSFLDADYENVNEKDDRLREILKDLRTNSPKAKVKGVIKDIKVFYRCELNEIKSETLKKFIDASNQRLKQNRDGDYDFVGKVDKTYSINGKPILDGEIEIKYYIEVEELMSIGDKAVLGNQLKFTVGDVYSNKVTTTESKDEIDVFFSYISIKNRIVVSPDLIGTTAMLLEVLQKKMCKTYFGEE